MHIDVDLAIDFYIGVLCVAVRQVVEGEDDGAIRRVFKGDNAEDCAAVLDLVKHVCASSVRRLLHNFARSKIKSLPSMVTTGLRCQISSENTCLTAFQPIVSERNF